MNVSEEIITNIITGIVVVVIITVSIFRIRRFFKYGLPAKLKQKLAGNPGILKQQIAAKIADFKAIKKIKKLDKETIDLEIEHMDSSVHWYRVKTNGETINPKILSLNKYS